MRSRPRLARVSCAISASSTRPRTVAAALTELPITGLVGAETCLPGIASVGARSGGAMAARRSSEAMVKNSVNRARQTILTIAGDREMGMNILEREYGG
jgi:hypothetical protein